MDLPFVVKMEPDERSITVSRKPKKYIRSSSDADVVMISGCKDHQTSADAHIDNQYSGAITKALHETLNKRPKMSFHHLLQSMRRYLKRGRYTQVPQMSSEKLLDLAEPVPVASSTS